MALKTGKPGFKGARVTVYYRVISVPEGKGEIFWREEYARREEGKPSITLWCEWS